MQKLEYFFHLPVSKCLLHFQIDLIGLILWSQWGGCGFPSLLRQLIYFSVMGNISFRAPFCLQPLYWFLQSVWSTWYINQMLTVPQSSLRSLLSSSPVLYVSSVNEVCWCAFRAEPASFPSCWNYYCCLSGIRPQASANVITLLMGSTGASETLSRPLLQLSARVWPPEMTYQWR